MKKVVRILCVFWMLTSVSLSFAQEKTLVIGVGNFEPYFIASEEGGLFTDLIKETFKELPQYSIEFLFGVPVARLVLDFEKGRFDSVANIFEGHEVHGCKSEPVFRFQDVAVTLKKDNLSITTIADLKDKRVVGYQGAKIFLGDEFKAMADANPDYAETAKPDLQARMLNARRMDVSIGDIYIFLYNLKAISKEQFTPEQFDFHEIFPPMFTAMAFKEQRICDDFNRALRTIKEDGRYEAIYQKYLTQLGYVKTEK